MAGTLYLQLYAGHRSVEAGWCVREADTRAALSEGTLTEAATAAIGRRVILLVPGTDVLLTHVAIPTRQRQRLLKAVPYALEEQLAEEVDALHFALGERDADGRIAVAVVARTLMGGWLERLRVAGLHPSVIVPDTLGLPVEPGQWSLLIEGETALLRCGAGETHTLPLPLPVSLLEERIETGPVPDTLRIYAPTGVEPPAELARLCSQHDIQLKPLRGEGALDVLATGLGPTPAINLLQGPYAHSERRERAKWRPWLPAAAMLGAVAILQTGMLAADHQRLAREAAHLAEAIDETYRQAFPEATRVVAARIQMERQLRVLQGGGTQDGFGVLLANTAPVLQRTPGLDLRGLRYGEGTLEIDLRLADLPALDTLKQELASAGLAIEIQGANARNGGVESRVVIRRQSA